jgi:mono/diheme cytochrome c family protein
MLPKKSRVIIFLLFIFIFLIQTSQSFSDELKTIIIHEKLSLQNDPNSKYHIRMIGHGGKPHTDLDLDADRGPGICPQMRNTPQAPKPYQKMINPLDPTKNNLRAGEALFKVDAQPTACKVCHGLGGDGLGIVFKRLQPKPRNFTCYYTMEGISDGQVYWIIKNGSPGTPMPSFGALSDKQVWQLVLYIRQFAQNQN